MRQAGGYRAIGKVEKELIPRSKLGLRAGDSSFSTDSPVSIGSSTAARVALEGNPHSSDISYGDASFGGGSSRSHALVQGLLTCAVFLFGFAIPVLAGLQVGGVVSIWSGSFWSTSAPETERLFPNSFQINAQGAHLRVKHQPAINPQPSQEFLLTAWFNLRRMPLPGEKLILLSKYEGSGKLANGYAIGLSRDDKSLRPVVYWGGAEVGGRWYDFPEITLTPRTWFMLGLSFTGERFLGLYQGVKQQSTNPTEGDDLQLLGGYELTDSVFPSSDSSLVVGAVHERQFRGLIGPLGLYAGKKISRDLKKALSQVVSLPLEPSREVAEDSLVAWISDASALDPSAPGAAEGKVPEGTQFISASMAAQKAPHSAETSALIQNENARARLQPLRASKDSGR